MGLNPTVGHFASIVVLLVAFVFLLAALAGAEAEVAWSTFSGNGVDGSLGLTRAVSSGNGIDVAVEYDSNRCEDAFRVGNDDNDICTICKDSGGAVISFLVFAWIAIFIALAFIVMTLRGDVVPKIGVYFTLAVTEFCFFICWVSWAGGCHMETDDSAPDGTDVNLGAGWALTFMNFILFIPAVMLIQYFTDDDAIEAPPQQPGVGISSEQPMANVNQGGHVNQPPPLPKQAQV
eukprot:CAMPEP_0185255486 /NCGR_PEP_ID=MMETSP1359-20130426/4533_1 /TAXON_ID=552665 /ORGANISM="Bigelowiella longifila, Strain CCMP242" /LENGTH=233 /DNA_ID=CAMNT_0027839433 /DNA_START=17 /DNA_END=718 /DNA_ORIENTATION=-